MASHRSTDSAPADDQAFAESFDETKARTSADQRRPDGDKADGDVKPVDEALDGAVGERFGEQVDPAQGDGHPLENVTDIDAVAEVPDDARRDGVRPPDDPDDPDVKGRAQTPEEKLDEAMEETFPASDPPPIRPGEG